MTQTIKKSSKSRLTPKQIGCFPESTLFHKIARAVCRAGTLPAKELFEAWEVARRVRRKFRGGRVVDMAGGHGLLAHIMLLLDDGSPGAFVVDRAIAPNAQVLSNAVLERWPRLQGRIEYCRMAVEEFEIDAGDLVVSVHACGALTDTVMDGAIRAGARVALLPCCHDLKSSDTGGLEGWMEGALAVDAMRAVKLKAAGYTVMTRTIPRQITPQNRLLMGHRP